MIAQLHILDIIEQRFRAITVLNGYNIEFTADTITRGALYPFRNGDLPALNYWTTDDTLVDQFNGYETRELNILIEAYTIEVDENNIDTTYLFAQDLTLALYDRTTPFDDRVNKMRITRITPIVSAEGDPWRGVLLELVIEYSIDTGNFNI